MYGDTRPEYHKVYRLRDETGHEFSNLLEVHIIELNKPLSGTGRMDDWIRLFNAKTEEELKMLETSTKNAGILAAVEEVREMSLLKSMKALHEAKLKEIRDRNARESYVRKEGIEQGEDRLNRLNLSLIADKRYEDLERAAQDKHIGSSYIKSIICSFAKFPKQPLSPLSYENTIEIVMQNIAIV